jgi:hypothetical protein
VNGADPNYCRQDMFRDETTKEMLYWYNADGSEKPEIDDGQPTTPLKLCVFLYSNSTLTDDQRMTIRDIVTLLIQYGGMKVQAREFFEYRYGKPSSGDYMYELLGKKFESQINKPL